MKIFPAIAAVLLLCLAFALPASAADAFRGTWVLAKSAERGKVQFTLTHRHEGGGFSQHESDWSTSAFTGLDLTTSAKHDVAFVIEREAGRIECKGFLEGGEGAGSFTFTLSPKYLETMRSLGHGDIDENKQFVMAVHDITTEFARQMKGMNLRNYDTDKLVAFGLFEVNRPFIEELRAAGLVADDADTLIAFRVHGITPALVRAWKSAGLSADEPQLIAMKIHDVTPEFIDSVQGEGFPHPEADELIAMRIHDVTPEYIADLRAKGMKNLTIDKLVTLKIHDIH